MPADGEVLLRQGVHARDGHRGRRPRRSGASSCLLTSLSWQNVLNRSCCWLLVGREGPAGSVDDAFRERRGPPLGAHRAPVRPVHLYRQIIDGSVCSDVCAWDAWQGGAAEAAQEVGARAHAQARQDHVSRISFPCLRCSAIVAQARGTCAGRSSACARSTARCSGVAVRRGVASWRGRV